MLAELYETNILHGRYDSNELVFRGFRCVEKMPMIF